MFTNTPTHYYLHEDTYTQTHTKTDNERWYPSMDREMYGEKKLDPGGN